MTSKKKKLIVWWPRVLVIAYAVFLSLFALDVFGEGYSALETLVALFMHLIPTMLTLVALAVAWKRPLMGAVLFVLLAVATFVFFKTYRHPLTLAFITGPLVVVAVGFGLAARIQRKSVSMEDQAAPPDLPSTT